MESRYHNHNSRIEAEAASKGLGLDLGGLESHKHIVRPRWVHGGRHRAVAPEMRLHAQSPDHTASQIEHTPALGVGKSGLFQQRLSDNIEMPLRAPTPVW